MGVAGGDRAEVTGRRSGLAREVLAPAGDRAIRLSTAGMSVARGDRGERAAWRSAWPEEFFPQQATVASALTPQLWAPPAETELKVPPGGLDWPLPLAPQQARVPFVLTAQLCDSPAEMAMKVPVGGLDWPFPFAPQQLRVPSCLMPHVWIPLRPEPGRQTGPLAGWTGRSRWLPSSRACRLSSPHRCWSRLR